MTNPCSRFTILPLSIHVQVFRKNGWKKALFVVERRRNSNGLHANREKDCYSRCWYGKYHSFGHKTCPFPRGYCTCRSSRCRHRWQHDKAKVTHRLRSTCRLIIISTDWRDYRCGWYFSFDIFTNFLQIAMYLVPKESSIHTLEKTLLHFLHPVHRFFDNWPERR